MIIVSDPYGFESVDLDWLRSKSGAKWHRHPGTLAAWVADMDFRPAPAIVDRLRHYLDAGDLGYPDWRSPTAGTPVADVFVDRCAQRYDWTIDRSDVREVCDVLQAVHIIVHLCSRPGDGIVVHTPAYPPFHKTVNDNGRTLIPVPYGPAGYDYDDLEGRLATQPAKILLLCHPQNPVGHVFARPELRRLVDIAERFDLLILSDEIHADLTFGPAVHVPIATLAPERTVTIHSASKAFNLAGLRYAITHVGPAWVRDLWASVPDHLFGAVNSMAAESTHAAWTEGDPWLAAVMARLDANRRLLATMLPADVGYRPPDATYLAWLDCRRLGFEVQPAESFRRRGVVVSAGLDFGADGDGHARLNFATSPAVLSAVVERMFTSTE